MARRDYGRLYQILQGKQDKPSKATKTDLALSEIATRRQQGVYTDDKADSLEAQVLGIDPRPKAPKPVDSLKLLEEEQAIDMDETPKKIAARIDTSLTGEERYLRSLAIKRLKRAKLDKMKGEIQEQGTPREQYPAAEFGLFGNIKNADQQHAFVRKTLGFDPLAPKPVNVPVRQVVNAVQIRNADDYNALPVGATYKTPDGRTKVKR